ncbi:MAG: chorismate mutase [Betaproteobacteria bacterium]
MKTPETCSGMEEIRADVNEIDRDIIRLLGRRLAYVRAAVHFKPDERSITKPDHWERFFAQRRAWGEQEGYDPDVIEALYRRLYDYTVEVQLQMHRSKAGA